MAVAANVTEIDNNTTCMMTHQVILFLGKQILIGFTKYNSEFVADRIYMYMYTRLKKN